MKQIKVSKRVSNSAKDVLNVAICSIPVPLDESYSLQIMQLLKGAPDVTWLCGGVNPLKPLRQLTHGLSSLIWDRGLELGLLGIGNIIQL